MHVRALKKLPTSKLLCVIAGAAACMGTAGVVHAEETQVTPNDIEDYEFDHINNLLAWGDRAGNVWIANIDPDTGAFIPQNAQGALADTGAVFVLDCGNGPEWLYSAAGNQIVYTKYVDPNGPHNASNYGVGRASMVNGKWTGGLLPGGAGYQEPLATLNPNDPDPRIFYKVTTGGWQMLATPVNAALTLGTPIPGSELSKGSLRWVPGKNQVIFTEEFLDTAGVTERQVFLWDGDSDTTTQLTFDNSRKDAAFMWQAPEFNNAYVFFAAVNSTTIEFYHHNPNGTTPQTAWVPFSAAKVPAGAPKYVDSPEPFVYQGQSYVFYVRSSNSDPRSLTTPTDVWLTSLNGQVNRQISDPNQSGRIRIDPEYYITTQGPYIYYNRRTVAAPGVPPNSEGVYRSSTGLGPQAAKPAHR